MVERIYSSRNIRQFRIEREFGPLSEPAKLIGNEDKSAREDEEEGRDGERNEKGDSTAGNSAIKSCARLFFSFSRDSSFLYPFVCLKSTVPFSLHPHPLHHLSTCFPLLPTALPPTTETKSSCWNRYPLEVIPDL